MDEILDKLPSLAKDKHKEHKKYFAKLRKKPPKSLDAVMRELHHETFEEIDCLSCANCCKTTGPLFTAADIERIAKYLKLKPGVFIEKYLREDEEGDMVLEQVPCTFLASDNYCMIYDVRPKACREFPHTDRKKFHQISKLTLNNTAICPAAYQIVEKMMEAIPLK
ncbi:YkgJ family cysteine cluster protein [Flavobacteriaceae bacterium M23B6Z8]